MTDGQVRISVPLDEQQYMQLRRTGLEWRLPTTAILRALLTEMTNADESFVRRIRVRAEDDQKRQRDPSPRGGKSQ